MSHFQSTNLSDQGQFKVRTEGAGGWTTNPVISGQPTLPEPALSINTSRYSIYSFGESDQSFHSRTYVMLAPHYSWNPESSVHGDLCSIVPKSVERTNTKKKKHVDPTSTNCHPFKYILISITCLSYVGNYDNEPSAHKCFHFKVTLKNSKSPVCEKEK